MVKLTFKSMLTNGPPCSQPDIFEETELKEILTERGLPTNGSIEMLHETYRKYDLSKFVF